MPILLYNTLTRVKEQFTPMSGERVGLYTCGPTVYAEPHLGNLRTYLFEDVLKRALIANAYPLRHVMNITDVGHLTSDGDEGEDKMEKGSRLTGKTAWQIAEEYTAIFKQNLADLNILLPDIWCRATDNIAEQINLIKILEAKGYTYRTSDGIYFDTSKLADYGKLARLDISGLRAGARIGVNDEKRNSADFALWKFSSPNEKRQMEWESPWGKGFPGWHIECSAMSMKYLGETFDIHCGGIDHIPVHHTNEIAQSEAATGKPLARYWLHGEFLVDGDKRMGKSEGNAMTLAWLAQEGITPLAYRYFCLGTHYRKPLAFTLDAVQAAAKGYSNLTAKLAMLAEPAGAVAKTYYAQALEAINDDLNTPQALAVLWEVIKSDLTPGDKKATVYAIEELLGLGLKTVAPLVIPDTVRKLAAEREQARAQKNWELSDSLRNQIANQGFVVDDTEHGPIIKKSN